MSPELTRGELGELIRLARKQALMSQSDLAREVETSRVSVSAWERGLRRPQPRFLKRIADVTGRPYSYFLVPLLLELL